MTRRLRVRPDPMMSLFGGIMGVVSIVVAALFLFPGGGVFEGGILGFVFIAAAVITTTIAFVNAFSKKGIATEIIELPDSVEDLSLRRSRSVESRLRQLDNLEKQGLITADERAKRRAEILAEV